MFLHYIPRDQWETLLAHELNFSLELNVDWYIENCICVCLAYFNGELEIDKTRDPSSK